MNRFQLIPQEVELYIYQLCHNITLRECFQEMFFVLHKHKIQLVEGEIAELLACDYEIESIGLYLLARIDGMPLLEAV